LINYSITDMKKRDYLLTGILLILIGVLAGLILSFINTGSLTADLAEVKITEVTRSQEPLFKQEDLEKIDSRFLFQKVAKNVKPAVVYIETIIPVNEDRFGRREPESESDNFWDRFLPPRARTVGSGVIITADGYILTNNHVIDDAVQDGISVILENKKSYPARVVGKDSSTDLAVIKIDANDLSALTVGDSDRVEVGEWVLAIGNPFRLRSTVTAGIVSALSRDVQIIDDVMRIESFIQTDAAINRGNSGGALVNTSGELIGINTAIATQSGNYQGYGFAVPSNLALKIASDLIEFGEAKRGLLGVRIESVTNAIAKRAELDNIRGVHVVGTPENGAAIEAGIEPADIILSVNGAEVNEVNQLQEKIAMYRPGDIVNLTIWRDGEEIQRSVALAELALPTSEFDAEEEELIQPENDFFNEFDEKENYEFRENSGVILESFDAGFTIRAISKPEDPGKYDLFIFRIKRNSSAWNAGLSEGMQILEIDGNVVSDLEMVKNSLNESEKNHDPILVKIMNKSGATGYHYLNK